MERSCWPTLSPNSRRCLILSTMTYTPTGSGKFDGNDEEGWTLLPGGKVLTVDAYTNVNDPTGTNSELYNPTTGSWTSAGSTIVQLWDSHGSYEIGPAVLRPDGTVFATGANGAGAGHTSVYNTANGSLDAWPGLPRWTGCRRWSRRFAARWQRAGQRQPGHLQHSHVVLRVERNQPDSGSRHSQFPRQFVLVRSHAGTSHRTGSLYRRLRTMSRSTPRLEAPILPGRPPCC